MAISINPTGTTAPQNNFAVDTEGYVQGAIMDDPSSRMWLTTGVIASTETTPIWPAVGLTEAVNAPGENALGNTLTLATGYANLTAFSTGNQAYNGIISSSSDAPQFSAGMTVPYFRFGSNVRIAVQCDPALVATLDAGDTNQQVSWDFTNQKLIAFSTTALNCKVLSVNSNSKIITYNSGTGDVTYSTGTCAIIQI